MTSLIGIYGGTFGNYMFFMLSGFLMAYSYRKKIEKHEISLKAYLLRRLCKLYPLYLLSNMVMIVAEMVQHGTSVINLKRIVLTLLLQCGGGLETGHPYNGPSWFISALFVCYLVFYFIAHYSKNQTHYICLIIAGIIWGYSIAVDGWIPPLSYGRSGDAFLNFFIGCALAECLPKMARSGKYIGSWIATAILLISGVLCLRYGVEIICGDSKVAFAFVMCPLLLYLAVADNLISRFLGSKLMVFVGKISVSVYFWHFVLYVIYAYAYKILFKAPVGDVAYGGYLLLLFVLSVLSWRFLENGKMMQKLQSYFLKKCNEV